MPSEKKYKLFAQTGDGPKVCAFYASPKGCRNGDQCPFLHSGTTNDNNNGGGGKEQQQQQQCKAIAASSSTSTNSINNNNNNNNEAASVISSEGEERDDRHHQGKKQQQEHHQQNNGNSNKKKNKNKRKHNEDAGFDDLFANPKKKNNNNNKALTSPKNSNNNKQQQQEGTSIQTPNSNGNNNNNNNNKNSNRKKQKTGKNFKSSRTPTSTVASAPDFRSFASSLPVASFSIPGVDVSDDAANGDNASKKGKKQEPMDVDESANPTTPKSKKSHGKRNNDDDEEEHGDDEDDDVKMSPADNDDNRNKKKSSSTPSSEGKGKKKKKQQQLPLPTHSEVGKKWHKAILRSRDHPRFESSFDFEKYQRLDEENGVPSTWVTAKPYGDWCQNNPQAIAIDCEMCETTDPLSGAKNHKALCRISVVNAENPQEVLLDTLVKPAWPVSDYRTQINGISKESLENVEFTLRHAQAFMMSLCSDETVIAGHAVHNDLVALNMVHHCTADSAFLFEATDNPSASVSLKDLVNSIFQKEMPDTHDSVNDARKSLECILHWIDKDGQVEKIERTPRYTRGNNGGDGGLNNHRGTKLFIHRIPKQCKEQHLISLFLKYTAIEPDNVDDIEYVGENGKTHVTFRTMKHANLAFETLDGNPEPDTSGRLQKKVYLRTGSYIRIRKMIISNNNKNNNNKNDGKDKDN